MSGALAIDDSVSGAYTVRYDLRDVSGNAVQQTRRVVVEGFVMPSAKHCC